MKKRYRILIWIVVALVLVAAAVWLARDWPRLKVQHALAQALDADVDLGRLEVSDRRTFVLHGLVVRGLLFYPWIESLEVDRLTVTGGLGEILDNRFEEIQIDGVTAVVRESTEIPPEQMETSGVAVGRLVFSSGHLMVRAGDGESRFGAAGEITGLGQELGGEVRLRTGKLSLVPLLSFMVGSAAVAGFTADTPLDLDLPVDDLEIDLQFGSGDAAAVLRARAGGGIMFGDADREPLPFPDVVILLAEGPGEGWSITAEADAPGLGSLDIEGRLDDGGGNLRIKRAIVQSDDPFMLLFSLGMVPEGLAGTGRAVLSLQGAREGTPACRVEASAEKLMVPWRVQDRAEGEPLLLDSLCPLELTYEGTLEKNEESGDWLTSGRALLASSSAGKLQADGSLPLGGGSANRLEATWNWAGPDIPDLRRLAAGFGLNIPKQYRLDGSPRAAGEVSGSLDRPVVSGTVDVDGVEFCLEANGDTACDLRVSEGTLAADFRFEDQNDVRFPGLCLSGNLQAGPLDAIPLNGSGSGRIDPETLRGRFEIQSALFGELARLSGDGRWDPDEDQQITAALRLDQADLSAIRRALVSLTGELLPGYELEAPVTGSGDATWSAADGWVAAGTIEMGEAWFASEDGARAVQGLASSWQVAAKAGPEGSLRTEASTTAGGFQLLWGSIFGDFGELKPQIRLAAGMEGEGDGAGGWWAEGGLQPVPGFSLQASLSGDEGPDRRFTASLQVDDLAAAYDRCARGPLGDSVPLLTELDTAGSIQAIADGQFNDDMASLNGRVRLNGLDLTGEERTVTVRGLELDLPLDLAWGATAGPVRRGRMGFEELRLDTLVFPRTDTALAVEGDTVRLEESQSIPLLGGTITFQQLTMADLLDEESRRLETGLTLQGLQLAQLSQALDWPLFEGEVEGHLPRVELSPTRLRVDGGGEISLFGGTVSISDISGEEVLSRYPRLSFSAEFSDIDLARLTRTFDFGEVSGILEGRVIDCRLFAGTPVGFRAEMRTVPREGVPQTINVKAINNIAIIGTGGRVTIFDRGLHSLLDRYTYEQLGVTMRLEKDMFYLRGTERRGERELFLKGRLPFRIDVVNAEPGKTVSFSTMLARLQALDFAQATTDSGGNEGRVEDPG